MPVASIRDPDLMQPLADFHGFRARNFLTLLLRKAMPWLRRPVAECKSS
jgi:hypothetical protein